MKFGSYLHEAKAVISFLFPFQGIKCLHGVYPKIKCNVRLHGLDIEGALWQEGSNLKYNGEVIILKISLLVDLVTPVVTGANGMCVLILQVPEFSLRNATKAALQDWAGFYLTGCIKYLLTFFSCLCHVCLTEQICFYMSNTVVYVGLVFHSHFLTAT